MSCVPTRAEADPSVVFVALAADGPWVLQNYDPSKNLPREGYAVVTTSADHPSKLLCDCDPFSFELVCLGVAGSSSESPQCVHTSAVSRHRHNAKLYSLEGVRSSIDTVLPFAHYDESSSLALSKRKPPLLPFFVRTGERQRLICVLVKMPENAVHSMRCLKHGSFKCGCLDAVGKFFVSNQFPAPSIRLRNKQQAPTRTVQTLPLVWVDTLNRKY